MRSRWLAALFIAPTLGLLSTFASAETEIPVSCSFSANGGYFLSGVFNDPYSSDRLARKGFGLGTGCRYIHHRFRVGLAWQFYNGTFRIDHAEPGLNGSFSFNEVGVKEKLDFAFILGKAEIGLTAGREKTVTSRLKVEDLHIDAGGGWLNLGLFATRQMLSRVDLTIWEVGLNTAFPLNRNFSFTFDLLWQKYDVDLRIDFREYGQEVLQLLDYDVNKKKMIDISQSLFYLTPGAKWCNNDKNFCASLAVPWGVFNSDAWSLGGVVGMEWKF